VIALLEPLARAKGLLLKTELPQADLEMFTDSGKVRQILLNLLSNAVKFTNRGQVSLRLQADGDALVWEVADTGIGIAPPDMDRIFEPFRQVGDPHTTRAPGTGLGLSVARHLAELLGGAVTAHSSPGAGSTFTVRLPRRSGDPGSASV
jgi:signal transduction histidine kinase